VVDAVGTRALGLAGHAAFETFSILTQLPPPARRSPGAVARLITHNFPATCFLSDHAAAEPGLTLMTRDRRAVDTYRRLDVGFVLLD
jgi:hypothetical protein